jgi:hypothetical protein
MGWEAFDDAIKDNSLKLIGPQKYTSLATQWLGNSTVAHLKKRSPNLLVRGH